MLCIIVLTQRGWRNLGLYAPVKAPSVNMRTWREDYKTSIGTTPNYANIKIPNTSLAHRHTQQKIATIRIKDEIIYTPKNRD